MDETKKGETPRCPVCASRHVTRAVVLRSDYRCPDCSALFERDERIVADPRPWVDPRTHANRTGAAATESDERRVAERIGEDDRSERRARKGTRRPRRSG